MKPRCGDNAVVYWRCVVRNQNNYCRATVIHRDDDIRPGLHSHSHPPKAGHFVARVVTMKVNYSCDFFVRNLGKIIVVVTRMGPAPDDYASRKRGGACGRSPSSAVEFHQKSQCAL